MRLAPCFIFLLGAAAHADAPPPRPRLPPLVEFYNQVAQRPLVKAPGGWGVNCPGLGERCRAEVDEAAGYLSWADDGAREEAALFLTADRRRVLVVSTTVDDGVRFEVSLNAWASRNGQVSPLPRALVPALVVADFATNTCDAKEAASIYAQLSDALVVYTLPRRGTTITAALALPRNGPAEEPQARVVRRLLLSRCYGMSIELPFDRDRGAFELGKRLSPPHK